MASLRSMLGCWSTDGGRSLVVPCRVRIALVLVGFTVCFAFGVECFMVYSSTCEVVGSTSHLHLWCLDSVYWHLQCWLAEWVIAGAVSQGSGREAGLTLVRMALLCFGRFPGAPSVLAQGLAPSVLVQEAGAIGASSAWCRSRLVIWARAWMLLSVSGSIVPCKGCCILF